MLVQFLTLHSDYVRLGVIIKMLDYISLKLGFKVIF